MGKEKTLYMIGNAHLDVVWQWQWQEGLAEAKATFRSALDRMEEYDDFVFTSSAASYYAWVEENEPAMFKEIQSRVKEGRWVLAGGWWIQPDCNMPCGESFVRQGLYGQRYFQEKFGVKARVGYNVDSFGHNGMLPQILKKSGMDYYIFMRPGRPEKGLEKETFRWRSPDGSEVVAFRIPFEYCTWPDGIQAHVMRCSGEIRENAGSGMCFYGVGNHGGGPTRKNIDSIHEMDTDPELPRLVLSSPEDYFVGTAKTAENLPVIGGDLLHHSSGCYSAHRGIKCLNRQAENRLIMAEKFSVMAASFLGRSYPTSAYDCGWKDVLFNQFHDILAGTSIEPAYGDAQESYGEALHLAAKGMNMALQAISWNVNIEPEEGMRPLVVFNPNAFEGCFEIEMESPDLKENMVLLDENDCEIPFQLVQPAASCNGRCRICFVAKLPSLGWRTYRLALRQNKTEFPAVDGTDSTAENRWFSIAFDEKTGYISSFVKKNDGTEYFSGSAAVPTVIRDESDTWAHGVAVFGIKSGSLRVPCAVSKQGL